MTTNEKSTGKIWSDPDDAPKLTQAWFDEADVFHGTTLVRRGRPKLDQPKQHVSLRLDSEVVERFKADGPGWQGRINAALRNAVKI